MQQPLKSLLALFKHKAVIRLFIIILLAAGVGIYWHRSRSAKFEALNVGGKDNACTCTQRLNQ
jgi:hypothetical protein